MLLMPLVRLLSARDPRWLSTLDAIEKDLVRDGMVYRYRNDESAVDGLSGIEGSFAACSFWYVECLARAGRVDKAQLEFDQLLRYANPLGLSADAFATHSSHLGTTHHPIPHLPRITPPPT